MESLLITTICRIESNLFSEISKLAALNECHINFSHLQVLGTDNIISLKTTGNWNGIAKLETALATLAKRLNIEIIIKRSQSESSLQSLLPYQIEIVTVDQPGIVYDIMEFFTAQEVFIYYLKSYTVYHQKTPILRFKMKIEVPIDTNIADLREQFLVFCDELNLDGIMEPRK